jgi:hypothetical protein
MARHGKEAVSGDGVVAMRGYETVASQQGQELSKHRN